MSWMLQKLLVALVALIAFAGTASAQSESQYADLTLGEMIAAGEEMVAEMQDAVERVREYRADAEADSDASAYQQLNNIFTQMNGRLLVAEEALANLKAARTGGAKQAGADRATQEHNFGLINAAYNGVMSDLRNAEAVGGDGTVAGDGTNVVGGGEQLPAGQVTTRGNTTNPTADLEHRDNADFRGVSPSTAAIDG